MRVGSNPTGDTIYPFSSTDRISGYEPEDECSIHLVGAKSKKEERMKVLIAKHKETGSEVLLSDPAIGESLLNFLNKEKSDAPVLITKEEFEQYLDTLKNKMDLANWCKAKRNLETPIQKTLYQDMCNWCVNELKLTELHLDVIEDLYYNENYILSYFDDEDYEIYIS